MLALKTHVNFAVPRFGVRKKLVCLSLAAVLAALAFAVLHWLPASASPNYDFREVISSPARLSDHVSIRAIGNVDPRVSLRNGHDLLTSYQGPERLQRALTENKAQPRSLASADFDEDGVPDLVSSYAYNGRGIITIHRGNVDSIYPNAPEAKQRKAIGTSTDAPFLSPAHVFETIVTSDLIGAGDFDADGHWDLVVGSHSFNALFLLSGDGHGSFNLTKEVQLPGILTAMVTGEINRSDGLTDVVVGVATPDGPKVMVFESPKGALLSAPEVFDLSAQASSLRLGFLDEHYAADLAIAAGSELLVLSGRDRKLSLRELHPVSIEPATFERHVFDSPIRSLAVGDFVGDSRSDIALLAEDGGLRVLGREAQSDGRARTGRGAGRWVRSSLSEGRWPGASQLFVAGVSSLPKDDLMLSDADGQRLHIVTGGAAEEAGAEARAVASSLDVEDAPVAVLPMRLDVDGLTDLAILRTGTSAPTVALTALAEKSRSDVFNPKNLTSFSNPSPITINGSTVNPYPSTINVSGLVGAVDKLRVRLTDVSLNTFSLGVLDILLVGPAGQKLLLMSDVSTSTCCTPNSAVTFTFDDDASSFLTLPSISGTYRPTDVNQGSDTFPAPAPAGPYAATLSAFNSTNPNGTWSLFVRQDDSTSNTGSIAGGWTLYFGPDGPPPTRVVTNTNDSGPGSLRQAMLDTNATFGPEIITFNIGSGPQTITPASRLPTITETVTIDATTQPGFAGQPIIELNMSQAGENVSAFVVRADSTVIRGFVINRHGLGSTVTGGINLRTGAQNIIEGNYIGTDLSGTLDMADFGAIGVDVNSSNNTVGGTTAASRNLLSGVDVGVNFFTFSDQQPPTNNRVQGNFIGTNPAGSAASKNSTPFFGVEVKGTNNITGGTVVGAGNLISVSRSFAGVDLSGSGTKGNLIQGNFIGTDVSGLISIGNLSGVEMSNGASSNTVGGSTPTARNLISGNSNGVGIGISGIINSTPDNIVQGNYIGTDVSGAGALANNGRGIIVPANVVGSQINANRIAFNGGAAVLIRELGGIDAPGVRVAIFENEIYANGFGIDLDPSGITPNDAGDPDDGANLRQNFPILTSTMASASSGESVWERAGEVGREMPDPVPAAALTINGTLNSTPNTNFTVHWYFSADAKCTANQAATRPLAFGKVPGVITNSSGDATFSIPFDFPSGINGGIINCTATDPQGNTSEFSACFPVGTTPGPTPTPTPTPTPSPSPSPSPSGPMIFVEEGANNLAAVDSVSLMRGPFMLANPNNFSSDQRTRILFFTTNLGLPQTFQPATNTLSVQVGGNSHAVETVGPNTTTGGSYIVFRLPDLPAGTYPLGIRLNGVNSTNTTNLTIIASPNSPAAAPKSATAKLTEYLLFSVIDLVF